MNNIKWILAFLAIVTAGCSGRESEEPVKGSVELFQNKNADKMYVDVIKKEWTGLIGVNGTGGVHNVVYRISLEGPFGKGTQEFMNPRFNDNSTDRTDDTVGLVVINWETRIIDISLKRITHVLNGTDKERPHPINGQYVLPESSSLGHHTLWETKEWTHPDPEE